MSRVWLLYRQLLPSVFCSVVRDQVVDLVSKAGDVGDALNPAIDVHINCDVFQPDLDGTIGQGLQTQIPFRVPLDSDR